MLNYLRDRRYTIIRLLLCFSVTSCYIYGGIFQSYGLIKLYAFAIFPFALYGIIEICASSIRWSISHKHDSDIPTIAVLMVFAFLPMLVNKYLFMDELWSMSGATHNDLGSMIPYSRPLAAFVQYFYSGIRLGNSNIGRLITLTVALLFMYSLYAWLRSVSKNNLLSFLIVGMICISSLMSDIVSFLAAYPLVFGIVCSCASYMLAYSTYLNCNGNVMLRKVLGYLTSVALLIAGFNFYPIATPIVFFLLAVTICFNKLNKQLITFIALFAAVFACASVVYYFLAQYTSNYYSIRGQYERGVINLSVDFIIDKLVWFFTLVVPQTIFRVWHTCLGNALMTGNILFFETNTKLPNHFLIALYCAISCIGLLLYFIQQRRLASILGVAACIVLSFYPFLILPESNYMSYYTFPLYSVLCLCLIVGLYGIFRQLLLIIARHNPNINAVVIYYVRRMIIVVPVWFAIVISSYSNSWVSYNQSGINIVKAQLMNQIGTVYATHRVHVFGTQAPVQASSFPRLLVQQLLYEFDKTIANSEITVTTDKYSANGISGDDFQKLYLIASDQQRITLDDLYEIDPYYGIYWLSDTATEEQTNSILELFYKSDLIPKDSAAFIDLTSLKHWLIF